MVLFFHSFSPFLAHVWHVPLFFLLEFFLIQIRSIRGFFSYYIYIEERCWKMVDRFYFLSSLSLSLWRKWNLQRSHENLTIILAREFSISDSANPFYLKLGNSILGPPPRKNSLFHSRGCSTASPSSSPFSKRGNTVSHPCRCSKSSVSPFLLPAKIIEKKNAEVIVVVANKTRKRKVLFNEVQEGGGGLKRPSALRPIKIKKGLRKERKKYISSPPPPPPRGSIETDA